MWDPVVAELDWGWGHRCATTSLNAWAILFNSSSKARNSMKMSIFGDLQKKRGKTTRLLSFSSLFVAFVYLLHFCYVLFCVGGHKASLVGALMDFLRLYLVPTLSFGSLGTVSVRSWSGSMSTSGRLSRWFMNLAALLIELGFNFQSSEGCLGLYHQHYIAWSCH